MFSLKPPGVYPVLRHNKFSLTTDVTAKIGSKDVVVVSVFGSSHFHTFKGYKRAFRLIVDSFGNPCLFSDFNEPEVRKPKGDSISEANDDISSEIESNEDKSAKCAEKTLNSHKYSSIDGFYFEEESVLFLHLEGAYDPKVCLESCQQLSAALQNSGFIPLWSTLKDEYFRNLLLLFSLSHILILSSTASFFETSYIHLFRTLDAVRQQMLPFFVEALGELEGFPKLWTDHGRICSPRVLFLFEVETECPQRIQKIACLNNSPMKEQQNVLEEEIYQILRKTRIITNISRNSLFAIPSSQNYVFLFDKGIRDAAGSYDSNTYVYFQIIHEFCPNNKQSFSKSTTKSKYSYKDVVSDFREFILAHTRLALERGFDDDSKRVAEYKHFFVVPTITQWGFAFNKLSSYLFEDDSSNSKPTESLKCLHKYINVDAEYLEMQCANIFPKIYSNYLKNLPEIYSAELHKTKLSNAINSFLSLSRGPKVLPWLERLAEKCDRYWKRRRQCETRSLLENYCTNPLHRVRAGDHLEVLALPEIDKSYPELPHSSGQRVVSFCNCGRRQGSRNEPFTIKEANHDYYERMGKECCERLSSYQFPFYVPADTSMKELSLQEMLAILQSKSSALNTTATDAGLELDVDNASQVMETELRQENIEGESESSGDDAEQDSGGEEAEDQKESVTLSELQLSEKNSQNKDDIQQEKKDSSSNSNADLSPKNDNIGISQTENIPVTTPVNTVQVSDTIEYLPGMLHSKTVPGLLPLFSSWSLVCLGSSSLYSHNTGVTHQPGFLTGSNSLLPWDVMVKAEAGVSKPIPRFIRGKRPPIRAKRITDEFNVKVFIGTEYECKRGHRFMLENPDKILMNLGSSVMPNFKEAATKVATSDMPLYFKCPCNRDNRGETRTTIAQLMRIHIVTPKAPVHVTINPRIQPGPPPCPVFMPGNKEPVKLSQSSYWVLRLPYCYVGDDHIYVPPKDLSHYNGKLLKGTYNVISMSPVETKAWEKQNMLT